MTINIEELRRLAQAAMHPVTKGLWMRLFGERTVYDRMEDGCRGIPVVSTPFSPPHPFEAACLDFIAAANPTAISELLDRLEATEEDRARFLVEMGRLCAQCDALRAKIAEMEKQEPVAEWVDGAFDQYPHLRWREPYKAIVGAKLYTKLYALPGAKGEEK